MNAWEDKYKECSKCYGLFNMNAMHAVMAVGVKNDPNTLYFCANHKRNYARICLNSKTEATYYNLKGEEINKRGKKLNLKKNA